MSLYGVAEATADRAPRRCSGSQQGALQQPWNLCVLLHTQRRDEEKISLEIKAGHGVVEADDVFMTKVQKCS